MSQNNLPCHALLSLTTNSEVHEVTHYLDQVTKCLWSESCLYLWNQLIQKPQGSVLATAACVPFWENLNLLANRIGPLNSEARAFFLLALTSLYPKYKDKRCLYQHSFCSETDIRGIPLTTALHTLPPFSCPFIDSKSSLAVLRDLEVGFTDISYSKNDAVRELILKSIDTLSSFLTSYEIKFSSNVLSASDGKCTVPLSLLQFTLWKIFLFCEVHGFVEQNKLIGSLTSSSWSEQCIVSESSARWAYKSFFVNFSSCVKFLLCVGSPKIDLPINNLPLLDFRLIKPLILDPQYARTKKEYRSWWRKRRLRAATFLCQRKKMLVDERKRLTKIKNDVEMFQSSSVCRNCDEMTLLCRDMIFRCSKPAYRKPHYSTVSKIYNQLLFKPKRGKCAYLPSLLPENEPCSMMDDYKEENNINLLEFVFSSCI